MFKHIKFLYVILFSIMVGTYTWAQTNVTINHLPITRFGYPGNPIKIRATIITQNCSILAVNLRYRKEGESFFQAITFKTDNSSTNYVAVISNQLGNIEYFIEVTNNFYSYYFNPERTNGINYYSLNISPIIEEQIDFVNGGSLILPDDIPEDSKYTGIQIPSYAMFENNIIGIENKTGSFENLIIPSHLKPVAIYHFYKKSDGQKIQFSFLKNVKISLRYFDEDNDDIVDGTSYDEADLKLYWWDDIKWQYVSFTIDKADNVLKAEVSFTGIFGIFYSTTQPESAQSKIIEYVSNPSFSPLNGEIVTFGIKPNYNSYKILIFDVNGRLIREMTTNSWDGRDYNGNIAATGIYIYQIIADDNTISGLLCLRK